MKPAMPVLSISGLVFLLAYAASGQAINAYTPADDTTELQKAIGDSLTETSHHRNVWGLDILLSNDGVGLGTFYRREFSETMHGFASFSISESKDEREFERIDYFGRSFVPGKLNRFLVMPLMVGVQKRLFSEDIVDTFRPYLNAGAGPAIVFVAPFVEIRPASLGGVEIQQMEFFSSLGKGRAHYTASAYVGFGANFGSEKSNLFGINARYYFTYLFGDGLPSLHDTDGRVAATKRNFGGFFITFNVGVAY